MDRQSQLVAAALVVAAVLAGVWLGRPGPASSVDVPAPLSSPQTGTTTALVVHVSGWVERPGLVRVPPGGRVADALAAAGGARPGAELGSLNLAQPVVDGQQVMVPGPGDVATGTAAQDEQLRLNQASATELETLPGVGPVLAERIVAYREQHGPFTAVEDLLAVSGIGEHKLESLREWLVVP